ncbi:MAG: hypothetical protein R2713_22680 [Ilumatobacteraceae bacterium]
MTSPDWCCTRWGTSSAVLPQRTPTRSAAHRTGDDPKRPTAGLAPRTNNVTPGWDAYNRDRMGFVPADRKVTVATGTQTVNLTRLTQPGAGPMIVEVPSGPALRSTWWPLAHAPDRTRSR